MPRRKPGTCLRRSDYGLLDDMLEAQLLNGHAWGVFEPITTAAEFTSAWRRWGDQLTERWKAVYPGSRPVGWHIANGTHWKPHRNPALRHRITPITGLSCSLDIGLHGQQPELDALVAAGEVDDAELAAAEERIASGEYTSLSRYRGE